MPGWLSNFFFFPFASFFQSPLPPTPLPLPWYRQFLSVRRTWKVSPSLGEGVQSDISYTAVSLSQWFQWQKCSCKLSVKAGGPGVSLWVTHPVAFGRKTLSSFPFQIFWVEVDMGRGLGRLLIQVLGWRVKHVDYLFNTVLRHPFPPDVTW